MNESGRLKKIGSAAGWLVFWLAHCLLESLPFSSFSPSSWSPSSSFDNPIVAVEFHPSLNGLTARSSNPAWNQRDRYTINSINYADRVVEASAKLEFASFFILQSLLGVDEISNLSTPQGETFNKVRPCRGLLDPNGYGLLSFLALRK